mmetsp:Transcript_2224/g.4089  ORF Transcript_2224/g.4089 Transcript_2224/m.4089 type:complete len:94 (-) Transcript_2224:101-382(-)
MRGGPAKKHLIPSILLNGMGIGGLYRSIVEKAPTPTGRSSNLRFFKTKEKFTWVNFFYEKRAVKNASEKRKKKGEEEKDLLGNSLMLKLPLMT